MELIWIGPGTGGDCMIRCIPIDSCFCRSWDGCICRSCFLDIVGVSTTTESTIAESESSVIGH